MNMGFEVHHLHRATTYVKHIKNEGVDRLNSKGETLINMGFEVYLHSDCKFEEVCMRTVPYFHRDGTCYIGRYNNSNMQKIGV